MLKIIVVSYSERFTDPVRYPHLRLSQTTWDDYGTKASYTVSFYNDHTHEYQRLGDAKVISDDSEHYDESGYLTLSGEFEKLPESYGFLGQSAEFYEELKKIFESGSNEVLEQLNDVSLFTGLRDKFSSSPKFKDSLIRFSDAERALKIGRFIIMDQEFLDSFSFEFSNGDGGNKTKCNFDFDNSLPLRSRINVIIGENGTGKTTYLSDLALSMSGRENKGEFSKSRPPFSKIIAVSFSSFDTFEIPKEKKSFSYKYCGLRDRSGFMNRSRMLETYKSSCDKIMRKGIEHIWENTLTSFFKEEKLETIYDDFFKNKIYSNIMEGAFLSSGESIILYSFTQIISEATEDSLILFDEPELHLHPQAISNMIPSIKVLLSNLKAYAIIATHSPIILQQIPSKFVKVFDNSSGRVYSRTLEIETLGENLNAITLEVFKTIQDEPEYKRMLKSLYGSYGLEKTVEIFNDKLSINAQLYLESLRNNEE
ncbi:ATP-dependent nuclease [Vibrio parahaemolyticus]|uniref:ATP-dependent nuclease n=1 Tax=Vibrio parahaemolyticus TaxID=670 RepID=UPI0010223301|nr:AAA family ATPase [Vibrio parahaemolyticus]